MSPYIVIFAFDLVLAKKVCAELHAMKVKCRHVDARSFTGVPEQGAAFVLLGNSEELKMMASAIVRDKHPDAYGVLALGQIRDIAERIARGVPVPVPAPRRSRAPRPVPADTPVENIPAVDPAKQA
jgi:hypothetical protein